MIHIEGNNAKINRYKSVRLKIKSSPGLGAVTRRRSRASVIMINGIFIYPTSLNSYGNIGRTTAQKVTKHKS